MGWHLVCGFFLLNHLIIGIPERSIHPPTSGSMAYYIWLFSIILANATVFHVSKLQNDHEYILLAGSEIGRLPHQHGKGLCYI